MSKTWSENGGAETGRRQRSFQGRPAPSSRDVLAPSKGQRTRQVAGNGRRLSTREAGGHTSSEASQRERTKRSFEYRLWIQALSNRGELNPASFTSEHTFASPASTPVDARREKPARANRAGRTRAGTNFQPDITDKVAAAVASGPGIDKVEEWLRKSHRPPSAARGDASPPSPIGTALAAVRWLLARWVPRVDLWMGLACGLLLGLFFPAVRPDEDSACESMDGLSTATLGEAERRLTDARRDFDECLLRLRRAQRYADDCQHEVTRLRRSQKVEAMTRKSSGHGRSEGCIMTI